MEIGAQFYTVRNKCTNLEDFSETLARVAEIGYKTVQISGVCAYEPEWLDEQLKKNGLRCVLTHYNAEEIKNDPLGTLNKHKAFGCNNVGIGCMPGLVSEETVVSFIENFKKPAQIISQNGGSFFYHNHAFEFEKDKDGKFFLDRLLEAFTKEELKITFDTYWGAFAGMDLVDVIEKLDGRLECVHLKDLKMVDNKQQMAVVGEGNINFGKLIPLFEKAGTKYLLVEQDDTYGECPFECLKKSYKNLKAMGL